MGYENAAQFDRAAKRSIKNTGKDPGIAYREMLRDRFLCRVFSEDDPRFLLKGGPECSHAYPTRASKDIDFATRRAFRFRGGVFDRVEVLRPGIVQSGFRQCLMEPRKYRMGFLSVIYHSG